MPVETRACRHISDCRRCRRAARRVGFRIEHREIDRGSVCCKVDLVLGVEVARIAHEHVVALPWRFTAAVPRSSRTLCLQFGTRERLGARQQHRVAEMHAGLRIRQHVGEENALVDLDAVLVALHLLALRMDLGARGIRPGMRPRPHRRAVGAHEAGLTPRERRVDAPARP